MVIKKLDSMEPLSQSKHLSDVQTNTGLDQPKHGGRIDETVYQCKSIFIQLFSERGISNLELSCSFPNEAKKEKKLEGKYGIPDHQLKGPPPPICHAVDISSKVNDIYNDKYAKQELNAMIQQLKYRRARVGLKHCDTNFVGQNIDQAALIEVIKAQKLQTLGRLDQKI